METMTRACGMTVVALKQLLHHLAVDGRAVPLRIGQATLDSRS
jgi:hypothetical protein